MKTVKTKLIIVACVLPLLFMACGKDDDNPNPPTEKEEMFAFLKVGNSWTYETGFSPMYICKFTIDSTEIISENESKYFGTFYRGDHYNESFYDTLENELLFHLKDSVLFVSLEYLGCRFDYNWKTGEVIDSLWGQNQDGKTEWFPITVSKGNYHNYNENFTYTDCIMFEGNWSYSVPNSPGGSGQWLRATLSNKYGLIDYSSGTEILGNVGATIYRLIHKNF